MKILTVVGITAFLCCCDAWNFKRSKLRDQMVDSGTVVFLDFVERVRNVTEKIIRDDQFRKSRIAVQGYMKDLREFAKSLKNGVSEDNSAASPQFFTSAGATLAKTMAEIFDKFFFPYMNIYPQAFKNETVVEIWKEVDSNYLPGAPPIYNKPMEFFSFLLARVLVKSQAVKMFEAGLKTVREIGKIDFKQLHEEAQMVLDQIRHKAFEISTLERQKEKNDFLISLRTASGLIVFYWDEVLEQTESPSFHSRYLESKKRWTELTKLRNKSENYLVLLNPLREEYFWNKRHYGKFWEKLSQEYYNRGNEALGLERFNQSNWAVVKSAVVYSLPVYEKLSDVGFEFNEVNRFLYKTDRQLFTFFFEDPERTPFQRQTFLEHNILFIFQTLGSGTETEENKDNPLLLPLRAFKKNFKNLLESIIWLFRLREDPESWNDLKSNFIDELVKRKVFTREQIEETLNKQTVHQIVEKLKLYTDLFDDFDDIFNKTILVQKCSLLATNYMLPELLDLLLE